MDPIALPSDPVCRLCLASVPAMTLLNDTPHLIDSIRTITGVDVLLARDPSYSVHMCPDCAEGLQQCIRFRDRCIESDGVFREWYELEQPKPDIKKEPVEVTVEPDLGEFGGADEAESDEWQLPEPEVPKKKERRKKEKVVASQEEAIPMAQCQLCGKVMKKVTLTAHLSTHNPNRKQYICPYCQKVFYNSLKLKNHVNGVHTHETKYACEVCGKTYERTDTLRVHFLAEHTDEKRYECKECGMRFARESGRRYHILKEHTVGKPHHCEYCGKSFKRKPDLTLHVRTHTGEKPFSCDICGKTFNKSYNVVIHKKSHQKAAERAAAAAASIS